MCSKLSFFCLIVIFVQDGFTKLAPDYIHPCKLDDKTCLIQSTQYAFPQLAKGLAEFGVPSLDPHRIEKMALTLPGGLKVTFFNCKVTGYGKAIVENCEFNPKKQQIIVEFRANVTLKGTYEATGSILALPINGEGDARIKMYNLRTKATINIRIVPDDNGVKHLTIKNHKLDFSFGDKGTYNLTNLFKGSPELSNTVLKVINDNWKLVSGDIGTPVMEEFTGSALKAVGKFFLAVPIEELIDGPIPF